MAFKILPDDAKAFIGNQLVQCHMVFNIKMEDFRYKALHVAEGCMTKASATITYASLFSRETVRIALMTTEINDLEVKSAEINNVHLHVS